LAFPTLSDALKWWPRKLNGREIMLCAFKSSRPETNRSENNRPENNRPESSRPESSKRASNINSSSNVNDWVSNKYAGSNRC